MIPAKEIEGELWIRAADARIKEAAELRLQMDLRDYFAAKAMQVILQDQYRDGIYVCVQTTSQKKPVRHQHTSWQTPC